MGNTTRDSRSGEKRWWAPIVHPTPSFLFPQRRKSLNFRRQDSSGLLGPSISSRQYLRDALRCRYLPISWTYFVLEHLIWNNSLRVRRI